MAHTANAMEPDRKIAELEIAQDDSDGGETGQILKPEEVNLSSAGAARAEALQAVWGRNGKYWVWTGIALLMIAYELDNSTTFIYASNYAPSTFNALSKLAPLSTASSIVFAVCKPPIAKLSDIIGRPNTYCLTISCYLLGFILMSASPNFSTFAVGRIFYAVGQSGTTQTNDVLLSDLSSTRWRLFALNIQFWPFLIMPWIAGSICDAVVKNIGWRWGIGMEGFIYPGLASVLITTLFIFQRRAKKARLVTTQRITFYKFFSAIDGGGLFLLCGGFAMFFLPISLAATTPSRWNTPWIIAVMVIGACLLISLAPYEHYLARHPVLPTRYFRNATIVLAATLAFLDAIPFQATHTYLYAWVTIVHDYPPNKATYLTYINGVVQAVVGILGGLVVSRSRRYKWLLFAAVIIRTVGYGVMVDLRGSNNSAAELFVTQAIQGIGSGVVSTTCIVAAQIVVPHAEVAQITSIILLMQFLGSGVGTTIAGSIYTNSFRGALQQQLGPNASEATINAVYNSITSSDLPAWETAQRTAVNNAYSEVMRYICIAAVCCSGFSLLFALFIPNHKLHDEQNLTGRTGRNDDTQEAQKEA